MDPQAMAQLLKTLAAMAPPFSNSPAFDALTTNLAAAVPMVDTPGMARIQAMIAESMPKVSVVEMAGIRTTFLDSVIPKSTFAELAGMRMNVLNGLVPKTSFMEMAGVRANVLNLMPKANLFDPVGIKALLESAVPPVKFSELAGFQSLAAGMAESIKLTGLDAYATSIERIIPSADSLDGLIDEKVLSWAASLDVGQVGPIDDGFQDEAALDAAEQLAQLRVHMQEVASWIFLVATKIRAGSIKLNSVVDVVNEQSERYQKLATNLLWLYGAVTVLSHLI
ncbi:MAG: hypothetical protein QOH56_2806 [Pseudonocardiales bacterium]|nr:hypothetical protein [Pseudonocardiales bacterium]